MWHACKVQQKKEKIWYCIVPLRLNRVNPIYNIFCISNTDTQLESYLLPLTPTLIAISVCLLICHHTYSTTGMSNHEHEDNKEDVFSDLATFPKQILEIV